MTVLEYAMYTDDSIGKVEYALYTDDSIGKVEYALYTDDSIGKVEYALYTDDRENGIVVGQARNKFKSYSSRAPILTYVSDFILNY